MSEIPSSKRGSVRNFQAEDFPNEPGWYYWEPFDGIKHQRAEYVMVNYHPGLGSVLRVWRACTLNGTTQPVQIMIGEWNFFMKLNTEKPE